MPDEKPRVAALGEALNPMAPPELKPAGVEAKFPIADPKALVGAVEALFLFKSTAPKLLVELGTAVPKIDVLLDGAPRFTVCLVAKGSLTVVAGLLAAEVG